MMKKKQICVVLVETKDDINIGNTVRACKNFGVFDLRLVRPRYANKEKIAISAPRSEEMIAAIQHFPTLEDAVADRDIVVGLTARKRYADRSCLTPQESAKKSLDGKIAFVFGREDRGLTNSELDLCDALVNIPTNPDYSSLNLGQAVLLQMWEVFQVQNLERNLDERVESVKKKGMEQLYTQINRSLETIGFYKYGDGTHILRGLRILFNRAGLSGREFSILFGIFVEVEKSYERIKNETSRDSKS